MVLGLALAAGASDVVQAVVAAVAAEWVGAERGRRAARAEGDDLRQEVARTLARLGCVCRSLRAAAGEGASPLWRALCEDDWRAVPRRAHSAPVVRARALLDTGRIGWKDAWARVRLEAKRTVLLPEDLLDEHARWYYRFREGAGEHWTTNDPWWRGEEASRVVFSADGRLRRSGGWRDADEGELCLRWRLARGGAALRVWVNGNPAPTYKVVRCEASWHFVVRSCWGVYMCGDMPRRGSGAPELEDDALGTSVQDQIGEAAVYNELLGSTDDAQPAFLALDDEIDGGGRGAGRGTARASRGAGPPSVKLWHDRAQEMTLERLAEHFAGGIYEAAAELAAELE